MPDRCASQELTDVPISWTSSANMPRVESEEILVDPVRPSSPDGGLVDNLVPLSRHALKYGELVVSAGNVVDADVDAVVNSADESCLGGGGQDGAIARAGGALLAEKRQALPIIYGIVGVHECLHLATGCRRACNLRCSTNNRSFCFSAHVSIQLALVPVSASTFSVFPHLFT